MEEALKAIGAIAIGVIFGILLGSIRNSIWQSLDDDYNERLKKEKERSSLNG